MKISLWHLYERLLEYSPTANISEGICEIQDVRVFSPFSHLHFSDYVYLVNISQEYGWKIPQDTIVLLHKNDMLILHNATFYDVMNKIMDIFDTFREIEGKLIAACSSDKPYEKMLDILYDYYHLPIVIANNNLKVLAATKVIGAIIDDWDIIFETQYMPITFFSVFNNERNNRQFISGKKPFLMDPVNQRASKFYRKLFVIPFESNHVSSGKVLINLFNDHLSPGDLQMGEIFAEYFSKITPANQDSHHIISYFENAILNGYYSAEDLKAIYSMRHWKEGLSFTLVVLESNDSLTEPEKHWCCGIFELNLPGTFAFVLREQMVLLIPKQRTSTEALLSNTLCGAVPGISFTAGVSLEFQDLRFLARYYAQCIFALRQLAGTPKKVLQFQECGFEGICSEIDKVFDWDHFYPRELTCLKEMDLQSQTNYYDTFYAYLQNDQFLSQTAQAIHIHPNTLKYRLHKIFSLLDYDPNDLKKRHYYLLCMQLESSRHLQNTSSS